MRFRRGGSARQRQGGTTTLVRCRGGLMIQLLFRGRHRGGHRGARPLGEVDLSFPRCEAPAASSTRSTARSVLSPTWDWRDSPFEAWDPMSGVAADRQTWSLMLERGSCDVAFWLDVVHGRQDRAVGGRLPLETADQAGPAGAAVGGSPCRRRFLGTGDFRQRRSGGPRGHGSRLGGTRP